jgi:hypothetical protein
VFDFSFGHNHKSNNLIVVIIDFIPKENYVENNNKDHGRYELVSDACVWCAMQGCK